MGAILNLGIVSEGAAIQGVYNLVNGIGAPANDDGAVGTVLSIYAFDDVAQSNSFSTPTKAAGLAGRYKWIGTAPTGIGVYVVSYAGGAMADGTPLLGNIVAIFEVTDVGLPQVSVPAGQCVDVLRLFPLQITVNGNDPLNIHGQYRITATVNNLMPVWINGGFYIWWDGGVLGWCLSDTINVLNDGYSAASLIAGPWTTHGSASSGGGLYSKVVPTDASIQDDVSAATAALATESNATANKNTLADLIADNPQSVIDLLLLSGVLQYVSGTSGPLQLTSSALLKTPSSSLQITGTNVTIEN